MPVVALLPGQRIALEDEQKRLEEERKRKEELAHLLPGQRMALEEERRLKERKLRGSRSESAIQQKQHSADAYVSMSPSAVVAASTITKVVEEQKLDTGQSAVDVKVFFSSVL
jgi:hypothetical protein